MSDLPSLLLASLVPATRKHAEQSLAAVAAQPAFLPHLLALVLDPARDRQVRLAGSVYFKNRVKARWPADPAADPADEPPLAPADAAAVRAQLVPAMLALSAPPDKPVRAQIAESVAVVAAHDFPQRWPDLIDQLVASLATPDYAVALGVLETAHSIFARWRAAVRSDALYTVINYVLARFVAPFLAFFRQTAALLLADPPRAPPPAAAQAQAALVAIFYDLTCQDLPPALEDAHPEFFGAPDGSAPGWFLRFLAWDPPALRRDPDDTSPSVPSQVKTIILEIAELYTNRFPELFTSGSSIGPFVQAVWELVGDGKRPGVADDTLVAQALRFLSTAIRSGLFRDLFGSKATIETLVNGVVVPNVELREHETEQFEDDPLEYIRVDLAVPAASTGGSSEGTTRRHAAADVLRALVGAGWEAEATACASAWVAADLRAYAADAAAHWKRKDRAIFLLTAVAARGTTSQGVTSTSALVKVVDWFAEHVLGDLQAAPGTVHPILQVDAIRYLYTFRNQLTKEQLSQVIPLLVGHLRSENYVCYSYAAIAVERILFIKRGSRMLFGQADVRDVAHDMLGALLDKIASGGSPEKVSENDYLMKCVMRVVITAREGLTPVYREVLGRLVDILWTISKNPSNPSFDQYLFESIAALIRFVVAGNGETLGHFEGVLQNVCTVILQQDVEQFVPYTFQILSQMLELHAAGEMPAGYRGLVPLLLTPAPWAQKGSIPGLVRYIRAALERDGAEMGRTGQFAAVLAVAQQRLIPSAMHDAWGFELLQAVVRNVPFGQVSGYFPAVVMSLLTRLQARRTERFAGLFGYFVLYVLAVDVEGVTPEFVVGTVEGAQSGLWATLFGEMLLPEIRKIGGATERKVAVVGLTRLLTEGRAMRGELWRAGFGALATLFREGPAVGGDGARDADAAVTEVDVFEQSAGYQAAYSRLAASEGPAADPVGRVGDVAGFVGAKLAGAVRADGEVGALVRGCDGADAGRFLGRLAGAGYAL